MAKKVHILMCQVHTGAEFIQEVYSSYKKAKTFIDQIEESAEADGDLFEYVLTMTGRGMVYSYMEGTDQKKYWIDSVEVV